MGADILSAGRAGISPAELQTPDKMSGDPTAGTAAPRQGGDGVMKGDRRRAIPVIPSEVERSRGSYL
jgi:hypothetical protein